MPELRIETRGKQWRFKPGETIEGSASWEADGVRSAVIRLFWRTAGKGTQDVGLEAEMSFDRPGSMDTRPFRFVLPAGPLSYEGKLVAIVWGLELEVLPAKQVETFNIVVSDAEAPQP